MEYENKELAEQSWMVLANLFPRGWLNQVKIANFWKQMGFWTNSELTNKKAFPVGLRWWRD